ncbi:hypothetical protein ACFFX0_19020 [Citricoccus parietis]|uniref:Uncharacterized protein n=1 Tax=Citricoccus parietis TaxID=592307 RepID=A0ABV5G2M1_9MICC
MLSSTRSSMIPMAAPSGRTTSIGGPPAPISARVTLVLNGPRIRSTYG